MCVVRNVYGAFRQESPVAKSSARRVCQYMEGTGCTMECSNGDRVHVQVIAAAETVRAYVQKSGESTAHILPCDMQKIFGGARISLVPYGAISVYDNGAFEHVSDLRHGISCMNATRQQVYLPVKILYRSKTILCCLKWCQRKVRISVDKDYAKLLIEEAQHKPFLP